MPGLRAAADRDDYLIEADPPSATCWSAGSESTGLTAGMAIAEHALAAGRGQAGIGTGRGTAGTADAQSRRAFTRPYQDAAAIAADPLNGRIVCFCRQVTRGRARTPCRSVIHPHPRRAASAHCRAQPLSGFFCGAGVGRLPGRAAMSPGWTS